MLSLKIWCLKWAYKVIITQISMVIIKILNLTINNNSNNSSNKDLCLLVFEVKAFCEKKTDVLA